MPREEETVNNLKNCPRFPTCSINICPLDDEVNLRTKLPEESDCLFTIKKRMIGHKGIKLLAPNTLHGVIPESNIKMLNKGNQKRWHDLHKKDGKK